MIFLASVVVALGVTLWLVSYIAKMLLAKRPGMGWIFLAWLVGGILAMVAMVPIGMFGVELNPNILFVIMLLVPFLISSAAYKYINQMGWGGAITTNIASSVIGMITLLAAILVSGNSIQGTLDSINQIAKQKQAMSGAVAGGGLSIDGLSSAVAESENIIEQGIDQEHAANEDGGDDNMSADSEEDDLVIKETDLLPAGAVKEEVIKQKPYVAPKYHVVRIGKIGSLIGRPIRIHRTNGKTLKGALVGIRGNSAVIKQRIHSGVATTPISIATISKLEVYR